MKSTFTIKQIEDEKLEIKNQKRKVKNLFFHFSSSTFGYIILIFWALVCLYPFFWTLFASFKNPHLLGMTGFNPFPKSGQWTLDNYKGAFSGDAMEENAKPWIINSVVYSTSAAFLNATLNLLGGYALARIAMKGKNMVIMYFLVSILVPSQATFVPTYFIFVKVGIITPDLGPAPFLFAIIFSGMANIILTFMARQFFLTQSSEMEEAGKMDGYSSLGIFVRITMRKMLPLFATQFVLVFMGSWNNFLTFQLFSMGDPSKMTLSVGAFMKAASGIDKEIGYGQALAISNVSFIPMILLYILSLRIQLRGIRGGNK